MANKKVVVAFSGGLDTSYTVMKLTQDGWDVYAACANTGGFSAEQLKTNEENAYKLGAKAIIAGLRYLLLKSLSRMLGLISSKSHKPGLSGAFLVLPGCPSLEKIAIPVVRKPFNSL